MYAPSPFTPSIFPGSTTTERDREREKKKRERAREGGREGRREGERTRSTKQVHSTQTRTHKVICTLHIHTILSLCITPDSMQMHGNIHMSTIILPTVPASPARCGRDALRLPFLTRLTVFDAVSRTTRLTVFVCCAVRKRCKAQSVVYEPFIPTLEKFTCFFRLGWLRTSNMDS